MDYPVFRTAMKTPTYDGLDEFSDVSTGEESTKGDHGDKKRSSGAAHSTKEEHPTSRASSSTSPRTPTRRAKSGSIEEGFVIL